MFERFSVATRRCLVDAQDEARVLGSDRLGTEHLLLGILRDDGVAGDVLRSAGIDIDDAREQAASRAARSRPGLSARAKRALQDASRLAQSEVFPAHLLLAVLEDPRSGASRIVAALGADRDEIRARATQRLRSPAPRIAPPPRRATTADDRTDSALDARLTSVQLAWDAVIAEARARATAEARLELIEDVREELERTRAEIVQLRAILGD